MDYSAVTDGQQQQQQQQYQQYQQPYDPSHAQSYDAYYASYYNHQQQHQQQQYDPSAYQYYPTNYYSSSADAYPAAPPPDPAAAQIHVPPLQQGYQTARPEQHVAAAVAAFSQLTEYAGTMDAAERAGQWHPQPSPHHYPHHPPPPYHVMQHDGPRPPVGGISLFRSGGRRGGKRGGGPYRGGRGNFGHHPSGQDGSPSSTPFRGRGRGRIGRGRGGGRGGGGGRQPKQSLPDTQLPHATPVQAAGSSSVSEPSAVKSPVQPRAAFFPVAWCDICRVDCNSVNILEQHKIGKRHKKTIQRLEKMQQQQSLMAKLHPTFSVKAEMIPLKVKEHKASSVGGPEKTPIASVTMLANLVTAEMGLVPVASENMLTPPLTTEKNMEHEMQNQTVEGQSETTKADLTGEVPAKPPSSDAPEVEAPPIDGKFNSHMGGSDRFDRGRGGKRKMRTIGWGGKRLRYNEPVQVRKPIERLKVREHPRYCTVCNVMCDTLAVFECHLSGKKHTTRVMRIQVPGTVFGPIPVYIPPNQSAASQGPEPVCYGLQSQDILQHEAYGLNRLQVKSLGRQHHGQPQQAREADGTAAAVIQADQVSEHPKEEVPSANVGEDSVPPNPESLDAVMESEVKEPRQAPVSLGTATATLESVVAITEDVPPVPEYGSLVADNFVLPGLDVKIEGPATNNDFKMEGPSANNEELTS